MSLNILMNKKALTLLEILVALIILAICIIGLVNVFISAKRYVQHASANMAGGEVGKFILDPLQHEVRQDTWDTGGLRTGVVHSTSHNVGPEQFNVNYVVQDIAGPGDWDLRRVEANINWHEE